MYRIKLSDNMIRQGFIPPRESFKTGREAYEHGKQNGEAEHTTTKYMAGI